MNVAEIKKTSELKQLVDIIKEVDKLRDAEAAGCCYRQFLKDMTPTELVLAEQAVIEESGVDPVEYSPFLDRHISLLEDPEKKIREEVPANHYLRRELIRHDIIESLMAEMKEHMTELKTIEKIDSTSGLYRKLNHTINHLDAAKDHFQAEEKILFNELKKKGVYLYPDVLKHEHEIMRNKISELVDLNYKLVNMDVRHYRDEVGRILEFLIPLKKAHIRKENKIIYPVSYELIDRNDFWYLMEYYSDLLGICCFNDFTHGGGEFGPRY